jgi:3-oxoacyl-[acyl-carrier protein] reductase
MSRSFVVTGAASGIGASLARELLRRGECVCAADIRTEPLEALRSLAADAQQLRIEALDVRDPAAWERVIANAAAAWGGLDVLLNVAGVLRSGYVYEATPDDVHFHFDINAKGVIFGTQAAARLMVKQRRGHIVNVASLAGIAPVPGISLYSASKFAVRGYSLAVAPELQPHGVRVSVVCPDAVRTPMLDIQADDERAAMTFSGSRSLTTDEVTAAIVDEVLPKAPLELILPRGRGLLAKLASALPGVNARLAGSMKKRGLARQRREHNAR